MKGLDGWLTEGSTDKRARSRRKGTRPADGTRFGRLLVIGAAEPQGTDHRTAVLCRCECGEEVVITATMLRTGDRRSCGCLIREIRQTIGDSRRIHGEWEVSPEYTAWRSMLNRCLRPTARGYEYYGARGVTICERWRNSFAAFLADMGRKPSPELTLDRIDSEGNYEPGNCRWATWSVQNKNKRGRQ